MFPSTNQTAGIHWQLNKPLKLDPYCGLTGPDFKLNQTSRFIHFNLNQTLAMFLLFYAWQAVNQGHKALRPLQTEVIFYVFPLNMGTNSVLVYWHLSTTGDSLQASAVDGCWLITLKKSGEQTRGDYLHINALFLEPLKIRHQTGLFRSIFNQSSRWSCSLHCSETFSLH